MTRLTTALVLLGASGAWGYPSKLACEDKRFAAANSDTIMGKVKAKATTANITVLDGLTKKPMTDAFVPGQALEVSVANVTGMIAVETSIGSFGAASSPWSKTFGTSVCNRTAWSGSAPAAALPLDTPCGGMADLTITVIWAAGFGQPVSYQTLTLPRSKTLPFSVDLAKAAPSFGLPGSFAWGIAGKCLSTQLQVGQAAADVSPPWIGWAFSTSHMMVPKNSTVSSAVIYRPDTADPSKSTLLGYALAKANKSASTDEERLAGVVALDDATQVSAKSHSYDPATKMTTISSTQPLVLDGTAGGTKYDLTPINPGGTNTVLFAYGSDYPSAGKKPNFAHHTKVGSTTVTWAPGGPTPPPTPPSPPPPTPRTCSCCDAPCSLKIAVSGAPADAFMLDWQVDEVRGTTTMSLTAKQGGYLALGFGKAGMGSTENPSYVYIGGKGAASAAAAPYKITGASASAVAAAKASDFPMKVTGVNFAQTVGAAEDPARTTIALTVKTADIAGWETMFALGDGNAWQHHQYAKHLVVDYRHGTAAKSSSVSHQGLIIGHAALMVVAWGLCIPLGVLSARFKKLVAGGNGGVWFRTHRAVQSAGVLAMLIGFALIVTFTNKKGSAHWGGTHGKTGLAVTVLGLFQPLNALVRPAAGTVTFARQVWEFVHKKVGYALVVAAWYNIMLGERLNAMQGSTQLSNAASALTTTSDLFFVFVAVVSLWALSKEMRAVKDAVSNEKLLG